MPATYKFLIKTLIVYALLHFLTRMDYRYAGLSALVVVAIFAFGKILAGKEG
jgi:hypothetical protein